MSQGAHPIFDFDFKILRPLGTSRGYPVQLAQSQNDGRFFVLKIIRDPGEANVLRYLSSFPDCVPHLLCYYDFIQRKDGLYMLATEYVAGTTLESKPSLTQEENRKICQTLWNVIQAIHRKGIVHGDIARRNIILTPEKEIVLIDVGEACAINHDLANKLGILPCKDIHREIDYYEVIHICRSLLGATDAYFQKIQAEIWAMKD